MYNKVGENLFAYRKGQHVKGQHVRENAMIKFADIHSHMLYGVDDGANTEEEMWALLEAAYQDGTRVFCFTPHYYPALFGDNAQRSQALFDHLSEEAADRLPEALLTLGNELRYSPAAVEWLRQGRCRTMNYSRYVLVDFQADESATVIESAIHRLLNAGYKPILAHAERYVSYHRDWKRIMAMRENSVLIQIDADSYTGSWGRHAKHMSKLLIKNRIVDIVSSDAHDLKHRPPSLRHYYDCVCRSCGQEYADHIFYDNPVRVLSQGGVNQTT